MGLVLRHMMRRMSALPSRLLGTGLAALLLATPALAARVKAVRFWHINADEPVVLQPVPDYKTSAQRSAYYAPDAYRSSDHDPVVIDLALDDAATQPAPGTNRAHR